MSRFDRPISKADDALREAFERLDELRALFVITGKKSAARDAIRLRADVEHIRNALGSLSRTYNDD